MNKIFYWCIAALFLLSACNKPTGQNPGPEPVDPTEPEGSIYEQRSPKYVNANLVYYGDDGSTGTSDWWILTLYTDMEVLDGGYPQGPGQIISLSFNSRYNSEQSADASYIIGEYFEQSNSGDFSAGSFMPGFLDRVDLPGGYVNMPIDTYYGDIPSGTTEFEPVLLREGIFNISKDAEGNFVVEGTLVGDDYRKYYVHYVGALSPVDRSDSGDTDYSSNSSLTADLTLDTFTQAMLQDYGDSYMTGDQSYRKFVLFLAEDGVNLSAQWPYGTGRMLRAEFFVPYTSSPADGVPAGEYTAVTINEGGGVNRSDMVPFRFVPGTPDKFTYSTGTWYQQFSGEGTALSEWARISGGTIKVERNGNAHSFSFDLLDCNDPAFKVTCNWSTEGPLPWADFAFD